jgi:hypothetical protein
VITNFQELKEMHVDGREPLVPCLSGTRAGGGKVPPVRTRFGKTNIGVCRDSAQLVDEHK